jgi:hypothetical protein
MIEGYIHGALLNIDDPSTTSLMIPMVFPHGERISPRWGHCSSHVGTPNYFYYHPCPDRRAQSSNSRYVCAHYSLLMNWPPP